MKYVFNKTKRKPLDYFGAEHLSMNFLWNYCFEIYIDIKFIDIKFTKTFSYTFFIFVCFVIFRKDVRLPVQLQRAMAAEAEAAREARAKVTIRYIKRNHTFFAIYMILGVKNIRSNSDMYNFR